MTASDVKETFSIDSNSMSDRCPFDGNQYFTLKPEMVESDGSAFAKVLLGRNNKTPLACRPVSFSS